METLDIKKVIEAAESVYNHALVEKHMKDIPGKIAVEGKFKVQDFTDEQGDKFTMWVVVRPFDDRPQEPEE